MGLPVFMKPRQHQPRIQLAADLIGQRMAEHQRLIALPLGIDRCGSAMRRWCSADRKSTRLNSSHLVISYAVFCLKKKKHTVTPARCERIPSTTNTFAITLLTPRRLHKLLSSESGRMPSTHLSRNALSAPASAITL